MPPSGPEPIRYELMPSVACHASCIFDQGLAPSLWRNGFQHCPGVACPTFRLVTALAERPQANA